MLLAKVTPRLEDTEGVKPWGVWVTAVGMRVMAMARKRENIAGEVLGTTEYVYGLGFRNHVVCAAVLEGGKVERPFVLIEQNVLSFCAPSADVISS